MRPFGLSNKFFPLSEEPSQSASLTALPEGEPSGSSLSFQKSRVFGKTKRTRQMHVLLQLSQTGCILRSESSPAHTTAVTLSPAAIVPSSSSSAAASSIFLCTVRRRGRAP